ncbi:MAG TPA: MarR family transcriptional regulator [Syntrophales bacterium]|jgi:DNA-binding MarR family transcriptional regulator|nr:MarR family transcriptional regulator [Syntrophales bacterium]HRT62345.1 MarR family transcriptional regulator [Syntrophales bacterium]
MSRNDRLIYLIFTAQQKLRTYIKNTLLKENVRVTIAQAGILFLLKQKTGQSMSEISQYLSVDNSTLTGLIDRLERSGFVRRNSNPDDRRSLNIDITESGLRELEKAKVVIRRINEEVKEGFSEQEIESFKKVLQHFTSKFGRPAGD